MNSATSLACGKYQLNLSSPIVMGVLNTTPDSFSDGGSYYLRDHLDIELALKRAQQMLSEGAAIIDVGGESTRPGAVPITTQQELERVVPVVEALVGRFDVPVSVDTSTPEVMTAAATVGAALINDVRALRRPGALAAAAATGLPVCLMHMQGEPGSMQQQPQYTDVVSDVRAFFDERIAAAVHAGITREHLVLDPGFGFGKTLAHNLTLLRELKTFEDYQLPLLVGLSRKSMLAALLDRPVDQRLPGSLALALEAITRGAQIIRVHDVAATIDVIKIHQALASAV
ncbi:MAG TPA: dihydropteroate synthase [Cellvibrionaceae bacterium]